MFRSLLSCASIFVLLISTFFSPTSVSARRCGEKMPETLLSLYRNSQFIYIGTFDRIEEGEITEDEGGYISVPIKKSFSLSTALKGETKKMLVIEETEYRPKPRPVEDTDVVENPQDGEDSSAISTESEESETEETAAEEADPEMDDEYELQPGDRVLLFLNKIEDSEELELTDYSDGLKKMTPEKLAAYEPRIRELNEIFSKSEPSYSEIDAWIVRCAEDPETRWEGTYELLRSFQNMDWNVERAKLAQQGKTQPEGEEIDSERYFPPPLKQFDTGDENFAKELTEGQKLLLTNMLLNRARPKPNRGVSSEDTVGMNRGDRELIELVKRWGDSKVATNILEQIRYDSSDPNLNSDLMASVASILGDGELTKLSEQYSAIQWRNESDEVDAKDEVQEPEVIDKDRPPTEDDTATAESVEVPDEEFADPSERVSGETYSVPAKNEPKNEPKKKTYGTVQAELLKKFLDRAERLIIEHDKRDKNE